MRPAKRWAFREILPDFSMPGLSHLDCRILARRGVQDAAQAQAFLERRQAASTDTFDPRDAAGLQEEGASVVVTVGCGVRSIREVEQGRSLGLDIIVTDHHLPGEALPAAAAVVNPKRPGDPYPFKG